MNNPWKRCFSGNKKDTNRSTDSREDRVAGGSKTGQGGSFWRYLCCKADVKDDLEEHNIPSSNENFASRRETINRSSSNSERVVSIEGNENATSVTPIEIESNRVPEVIEVSPGSDSVILSEQLSSTSGASGSSEATSSDVMSTRQEIEPGTDSTSPVSNAGQVSSAFSEILLLHQDTSTPQESQSQISGLGDRGSTRNLKSDPTREDTDRYITRLREQLTRKTDRNSADTRRKQKGSPGPSRFAQEVNRQDQPESSRRRASSHQDVKPLYDVDFLILSKRLRDLNETELKELRPSYTEGLKSYIELFKQTFKEIEELTNGVKAHLELEDEELRRLKYYTKYKYLRDSYDNLSDEFRKVESMIEKSRGYSAKSIPAYERQKNFIPSQDFEETFSTDNSSSSWSPIVLKKMSRALVNGAQACKNDFIAIEWSVIWIEQFRKVVWKLKKECEILREIRYPHDIPTDAKKLELRSVVRQDQIKKYKYNLELYKELEESYKGKVEEYDEIRKGQLAEQRVQQ